MAAASWWDLPLILPPRVQVKDHDFVAKVRIARDGTPTTGFGIVGMAARHYDFQFPLANLNSASWASSGNPAPASPAYWDDSRSILRRVSLLMHFLLSITRAGGVSLPATERRRALDVQPSLR